MCGKCPSKFIKFTHQKVSTILLSSGGSYEENLLINSIIFSRLQTMAVATLAACYNNPRVFTGVVKIRKGQAVALMMQSTNMKQLRTIMAQFAREVGMLAILKDIIIGKCSGISLLRTIFNRSVKGAK